MAQIAGPPVGFYPTRIRCPHAINSALEDSTPATPPARHRPRNSQVHPPAFQATASILHIGVLRNREQPRTASPSRGGSCYVCCVSPFRATSGLAISSSAAPYVLT